MEFKVVNTICPYCGVGCGVGLVVKNNKVVGVYPNKRHPINEGKLCAKGNYCYQFIHNKDRLKKPLIKKESGFSEISYKKALELVAENLKNFKDEIGFFSSARCTNEENYITQKFARVVLKTNNIDHCARL